MKISKTGFWSKEDAHIHHVHSKPLSQWIANYLPKNERVFDLGCGLGNYLLDLQKAGFKDLVGLEGQVPDKRVFDNIWQHDLTTPIPNGSINKGNIICLEVMEHIPAELTERVLRNIDNICLNYLVFSWAIRGQDGVGHVNCLNNDEVINMMEKRGYYFLEQKTEEARSVIDDSTPWFRNTLLIFKNERKNV